MTARQPRLPRTRDLEDNLKERALAYLKKLPQSYFRKSWGNPYEGPGKADITGVYRGVYCAFELKVHPNVATPAQKRELDRLRRAGAVTRIVYDMGEIESAIHEIDTWYALWPQPLWIGHMLGAML